jgi:hypothetical protein
MFGFVLMRFAEVLCKTGDLRPMGFVSRKLLSVQSWQVTPLVWC